MYNSKADQVPTIILKFDSLIFSLKLLNDKFIVEEWKETHGVEYVEKVKITVISLRPLI